MGLGYQNLLLFEMGCYCNSVGTQKVDFQPAEGRHKKDNVSIKYWSYFL